MIPKLIHFVWFGPPMPAWAQRNIDAFRRLNPEYEIRIHGEDALLPCYADTYAKLTHAANKCDLLRYSILEKYGGWYFDCDFWPFRPLAEAESAWGLNGARLFLAEQSDPGKRDYLNGAVLACGPEWRGWPIVRDLCINAVHDDWATYGPHLVTKLANQHPNLVEIAGRAWWYGPGAQWAHKLYRCAVEARHEPIRRFMPETGGQLPFAMHLWAYKHSDHIAAASTGSHKKTALIFNRPTWFDGQQALFDSLQSGLEKTGYAVERLERKKGALAEASCVPDLAVFWNGMREVEAQLVADAKRLGAKTLIMEHGFWQRTKHVQLDANGTQHRASWRVNLREPAPPQGAERLAAFYPNGVKPIEVRRQGYVLVLGQVSGDSQLFDSEIKGPAALQRAVKGAIPAKVPVFYRPHPLSPLRPHGCDILPMLSDGPDTPAVYSRLKAGPGLAKALEGARFVITINSTAGNEALAAGVPVLALGPALYNIAGVARPASVATLKDDIQAMLDGWVPDNAKVLNFLHWLACRQYSAADLADGWPIRLALGLEQETASGD